MNILLSIGKRCRSALLIFSILTVMLDSGGEIGLRNFGIAMLLLASLRCSVTQIRLNMLLIWLGLMVLLIPSIMRSEFYGVDLKNIVIWVYPFLFFPLIYFLVKVAKLTVEHFIAAGTYFGLIIILLFVGRITGNEWLMWMNETLTSGASGFFNQKQVFFEDAMPVVYFQGTLSLVFVSILAWGRKNYLNYTVMLVALILAPSRFGVTVSIILASVIVVTNVRSRRKKVAVFAIIITFILLAPTILPDGFLEIFNQQSQGSAVRLGHINSIAEVFDNDISKLIFGSGPGTFFYSSGFGQYTDNIEISQLELLRKYGILFTVAITAVLFGLVVALWIQGKKEISVALIAQYVVAASNPVLLSSVFLLFFSAALRETED